MSMRNMRMMSTTTNRRPVVLCILDGWGYSETLKHNAVTQANTPNFDYVYGRCSQLGQAAFLNASEKEVGLPEGQIGNSEVGHMNIGAGRVVYQDICTIDNAIEDGSFRTMEALTQHIDKLKASGGRSHVMGLVSPGGVHSLQAHMADAVKALLDAGIEVVVHGFTDGRDVPPSDARITLPKFMDSLPKSDKVSVGSITGRYYALDRDNRWERVATCYDAMVLGKGVADNAPDAISALNQGYDDGLTDEFVLPTVINGYEGMKDGDGLLMCNFRADRAREILQLLASPEPPAEAGIGTERPNQIKFADVCGMVTYSSNHDEYMSTIFPPKDIQKPLGEVVANAGMKQLRAAETEKYPHVTFFLNGGREEPYPGEERILVASPKVATYDLQPEMSAPELGDKVVEALDKEHLDMAVINFANPDMVGHSGDIVAAMKACEAVDTCLGKLITSVKGRGGALIVTADHGNCEQMWDDEIDQPHTAHTLNRVPVLLADFNGHHNVDSNYKIQDGKLADLAPTMLELLGIPQPAEMTGVSLIKSMPSKP